jgi:hypothetical protein
MSLVELKQQAKGRRIKQYYIMKRQQLIEVLSMGELPLSMKIEKYTIHELRAMAKEKGIRGFWGLHRDKLVDLLFPDHKQGNTRESSPHEDE